jgi:hypothetical protein
MRRGVTANGERQTTRLAAGENETMRLEARPLVRFLYLAAIEEKSAARSHAGR